jgi:hypothetical protein
MPQIAMACSRLAHSHDRGAPNVAIEKEQGIQGAILRRGCNMTLDGKMGEERAYFIGAPFSWVPFMVEQNKAPHPADVSLLGPIAHMFEADNTTHLIE